MLLAAEILSQELIVVRGEFPDVSLQKINRVDGAGPAVNIGVRPGPPAIPVRIRRSPDFCGTTQTSFAAIASGK